MDNKGMGKKRWHMRWDCARLMIGPILTSFLERLLMIASPTVLSFLIGDMANSLLALDTNTITRQLPSFVIAIGVQVLLIPMVSLGKNLLLTQQGTAYDVFLMTSTLHMPHRSLHSIDSGDYIYRFEEDRTTYYIAIMRLFSYPPAILVYGVFFLFLARQNDYNFIFCLFVFALSGLSVAYDSAIAKKQATLKRETSEYGAMRTNLELETFSMRDFSTGFGLSQFLVFRLRQNFENYWSETGKTHSSITAMVTVMSFLCSYGVQVLTILLGTVWVLHGKLDVGALLGGYLVLPTFKKGWGLIKQIILDVTIENKYGMRMAYFYQDWEPQEITDHTKEKVETIQMDGVCFSYRDEGPETISHVNLTLDADKNIHLKGPNGCGKSTLLSLIGGIYMTDEGRILDGDGRSISLEKLRCSTAIQEQSSIVFTGTVWENLFLAEYLRGEAEALLNELAFEKPLEYKIQGDGKNLSPGERKKLLLTRALLKDSPFLLLDEPLNHLDSQGKDALISRLKHRNGGIILVSHQEFEDESIPMHKVFMEGGHLV